jgi:hypothetical protein
MNKVIKKSQMKNTVKIMLIIAVISVLAIFAASCKWTIGLVRGSGDIKTEERDVSGFHKVYLEGIGNLIITQGDEESLVIEADDNIIPLIKTDVFGHRLTIGFKRGYNFIPISKIKYHLTVIDLDEISLSGAGDIDCDDFNTDQLEFDISGVGDIDFNINAKRVETTSSGAGDITLSGKVDSQEIDISGVGKYDAEELESRECSISLSGAGSVTVNTSEELDISISGVGNVYYAGDPHITQDISGLGRVKSID